MTSTSTHLFIFTHVLYEHTSMDKVHREQQMKNPITTEFIVFRGQGLSHEYFDKMKQSKGGLMAFNNFLSTSRSREISIRFARDSNCDLISAIKITIITMPLVKYFRPIINNFVVQARIT